MTAAAMDRPITQAANDMFVRNMRYLWRFDADLAFQIDAIHDEERLPVEQARSGAFTIRVAAGNAPPAYLHSRHDPVAEAEKWAASIPIEGKYCFVISALGLGYHVQALRARVKGELLIICIEPSLPMISTALACNDLTDVINSPQFILLTDSSKNRLHARLQPFSGLIMLGAQFAPYAPARRLAPEIHTAIESAILEYATFTRMSLMTLVGNAAITCKNVAMNIVNYVTTPPIDSLRDRFKGHPAIVISAGPSLGKNIDQLASLKGKAVLCAVQTALRPLLQKGISPDFVTSLDFHEMSRRFFENVGDLSQTHLVAEPKATWHVIDHYPGPVSLLDNHWARLVLGDQLAARDGLNAGATVAHLAFYLAVYMGCDPIIFVGQDLAFTGHVFYVPGVEIHQSWRGEINRFNPMEQKEWDRIVRNRPILRKVRGHDGGELYTDELLFTYLEQFEKDIEACPRRIINATEGGAHIRGTTVSTLAEVASEFCQSPIDPNLFAYRTRTKRRDMSRISDAMQQVKTRIDELTCANRVCDELIEVLAELDNLTGDPPAFNRRLARVDELRAKVHADTRSYEIINMATQLAELRRFTADRKLEASDLTDAAKAKHQIARDIDFITSVRQGAVEVSRMLQDAMERLRACAP